MQRAAAVLSRLKTRSLSLDVVARAAWPKAVGARLDRRTRASALVRQTLVVEVEDAVWQRQLTAIRSHILANLRGLLGEGVVEDLEFRIGIPRRPPQREDSLSLSSSPASRDEADQIPDPVFRKLYREGRSRSASTRRTA